MFSVHSNESANKNLKQTKILIIGCRIFTNICPMHKTVDGEKNQNKLTAKKHKQHKQYYILIMKSIRALFFVALWIDMQLPALVDYCVLSKRRKKRTQNLWSVY